MFKRQKFEVNPGCDETIPVRYIGKTETVGAYHSGCTKRPVQRIWDNAPKKQDLRRAALQITNDGILLQDLETRKVDVRFAIRCISYCAAEKSPHEQVFAWVARPPEVDHLYCYAVLCPTKEKAQNAAIQLSRAFQHAHQQDSLKQSASSTGSSPNHSLGSDIIPMYQSSGEPQQS